MKSKLHCAIDRDSGDTLSLVYPGVRIQFLSRSITRIVHFLFARFRSFLLVVVAMRTVTFGFLESLTVSGAPLSVKGAKYSL